MIVLDTNVLSAIMTARDPDDAHAARWVSGLTGSVATTAVNVAELLTGIRAMPDGRRRRSLEDRAGRALGTAGAHVLVLDDAAARIYAGMAEHRRLAGRPLGYVDGLIAAICAREGATLATRNTKDFDGLELALVDPWQSA